MSDYWISVMVKELPRKAVCIASMTVPQTDTGRWDEYSKVLELDVVKELGKLTP